MFYELKTLFEMEAYLLRTHQVDKLEQSEAVRSEEEQKIEERPIVLGMSHLDSHRK